jgi:hypothetical protein
VLLTGPVATVLLTAAGVTLCPIPASL